MPILVLFIENHPFACFDSKSLPMRQLLFELSHDQKSTFILTPRATAALTSFRDVCSEAETCRLRYGRVAPRVSRRSQLGRGQPFLLFCEARAIGWPWRGNLRFISLELFIMSSVVEIMGK